MQARRLLLVIGIVMLFAVVAASLVPPPEEATEEGSDGDETTDATSPTLPVEDSGAVEIEFRAQDPPEGDAAGSAPSRRTRSEGADGGREGQTKTVRLDKRVIVTVTPSGPGTVELEGLGRLQVAARGNPAVFDLFADRPGRFDVVFTPSEGGVQVLGTLVVERSPPDTTE